MNITIISMCINRRFKVAGGIGMGSTAKRPNNMPLALLPLSSSIFSQQSSTPTDDRKCVNISVTRTLPSVTALAATAAIEAVLSPIEPQQRIVMGCDLLTPQEQERSTMAQITSHHNALLTASKLVPCTQRVFFLFSSTYLWSCITVCWQTIG